MFIDIPKVERQIYIGIGSGQLKENFLLLLNWTQSNGIVFEIMFEVIANANLKRQNSPMQIAVEKLNNALLNFHF